MHGEAFDSSRANLFFKNCETFFVFCNVILGVQCCIQSFFGQAGTAFLSSKASETKFLGQYKAKQLIVILEVVLWIKFLLIIESVTTLESRHCGAITRNK